MRYVIVNVLYNKSGCPSIYPCGRSQTENHTLQRNSSLIEKIDVSMNFYDIKMKVCVLVLQWLLFKSL